MPGVHESGLPVCAQDGLACPAGLVSCSSVPPLTLPDIKPAVRPGPRGAKLAIRLVVHGNDLAIVDEPEIPAMRVSSGVGASAPSRYRR